MTQNLRLVFWSCSLFLIQLENLSIYIHYWLKSKDSHLVNFDLMFVSYFNYNSISGIKRESVISYNIYLCGLHVVFEVFMTQAPLQYLYSLKCLVLIFWLSLGSYWLRILCYLFWIVSNWVKCLNSWVRLCFVILFNLDSLNWG